LKILVLFDGMSGVSFHRLYTPYARLQLDYDVRVDISQNKAEWADLPFENYDVVVFNRWLGHLQYNILPILAKKNGVKDAIAYSDAITCTTPQLAEKIREFNPNVYILPNAVDKIQRQWNAVTIHPKTIGWVGGISHVEDLKLLSGQIKPICEEYGYRFLMCGYHANSKMWVEMERAITGEYPHNRPKWFDVREGTRADIYGTYYSEIDIVLAPLKDDKFNRYKSELKIVEAAAYKLPILVSKVEPYTNHCNNLGVFFVTDNDWKTPLRQLIESDKAKDVGLINHAYCDVHHNMAAINHTRMEVLLGVVKNAN
jgi:glycosyltransferase involved in cell wall biosynthesis